MNSNNFSDGLSHAYDYASLIVPTHCPIFDTGVRVASRKVGSGLLHAYDYAALIVPTQPGGYACGALEGLAYGWSVDLRDGISFK